jgi:hypothetical protein
MNREVRTGRHKQGRHISSAPAAIIQSRNSVVSADRRKFVSLRTSRTERSDSYKIDDIRKHGGYMFAKTRTAYSYRNSYRRSGAHPSADGAPFMALTHRSSGRAGLSMISL